ncbi:hypothetical protein HEP84_39985 [Streptomyces sp. RLB1-33]|nr:hypothetical protein [Streptomyces sp. RLB1-33]QIY74385.1 hypothetical protein HEP84_39985 [Streptomyces sp. RLB1-33]
MRKLTRRISLAAASTAVAGGAILCAGSTASAAVPESAPVERPAVSIKADDYRGDRSVAYWHNSEEDYRRDGYGARQHSDHFADSDRYDRHGHSHHWDDEANSWKRDRNYRYDRDRSDRNSNRYDRDWDRNNHDYNRCNHDQDRDNQ